MEPSDGCRIWPYTLAKGYGQLMYRGRLTRLNGLVCERWHGPRPAGMLAAHSCGNSSCWAGEHLRWATHTENMRDKWVDGTAASGERNGNSTLTEDDVKKIRASYVPGRGNTSLGVLADKYGVSTTCIHMIVKGHTWKHVS